MSTDTREGVDLDVDMDAVVPCSARGHHPDGCPAATCRCILTSPCCGRVNALMACDPCAVYYIEWWGRQVDAARSGRVRCRECWGMAWISRGDARIVALAPRS